MDFWSLRGHRTVNVRTAARGAQLAYAFLKGKKYADVERRKKDDPIKEERFQTWVLPDVKRIVKKFGKPEYADEVEGWLDE